MKKALALVLVAMMVFGMTSVAFAATNNVKMIDGDTYPAFVDATGGAWDDPDDVLSSLEPDSELKLWLNPQAFRDGTDPLTNDQCYGTGGTTNNGGAMSESVLRREKITVRRSLSKGGSLLDSVGFDSDSSPSNAVFGSGKASYVSVEFVEALREHFFPGLRLHYLPLP